MMLLESKGLVAIHMCSICQKVSGNCEKKPMKLVFEKRNANWIDELNSVTSKNNNTNHFQRKDNQTSIFEKNDEYVYKIVFDKKQKMN